MSIRTRAAVLGVAAVAALGAGGCGDDDEAGAESGSGEATHAVEIADFEYAPETLTVPVGTKVTWSNSDEAPHTATAEDDSFDTGTLREGDDVGVVLDEPGTYAYYCRFHAFMKGKVEVE
jgi:plastocyanin